MGPRGPRLADRTTSARRTIGLVVVSVTISIAMSLHGDGDRRIRLAATCRDAGRGDARGPGEPLAAVEALVGVPVMDAAEPPPVEAHIDA